MLKIVEYQNERGLDVMVAFGKIPAGKLTCCNQAFCGGVIIKIRQTQPSRTYKNSISQNEDAMQRKSYLHLMIRLSGIDESEHEE